MRKFSVNLRAMVLSGLLAAMGIVLQYFSITMPLMRIGISPVPIMVAGLVLGPVYGGITGLVKDTVGFLVAGQGSFFPPITVIQMLYGILPPLLLPLFRTPVHWVWDKAVRPDKVQRPALRWLAGVPARLVTCYLVVATTQFITGGLLMPAALCLLLDRQLTAQLWLARFVARLPQQVIYLAGYPAVTYPILEALSGATRSVREAALFRHT
ncbi:MAG: folate family ECF transporter S component [Firmicutes bacterium]|mgnify:CR=1 FL=1|nr:folate family ECF transporter S component [Bacillota bacterium]HOB35071.1 folate family ECF transporter S component [Bacillota bacterium]HPZ91421.1 folate family ECF transporter S component [Bacillota bacterium]HQE01265.1 folate family ECF transporter S component [Bacillota bacterium]